ncbi:hypothetical protein RFI_29395, partial [Reticulomyxa filosa]
NELQQLKSCQQKMEIILERKKSAMFQNIWGHFHSQYKSIQSQKSLSIFDKIFDNMSHVWKNFKQVCSVSLFLKKNLKRKGEKHPIANLQNQTLKYQDLEWVFTEHSNDTEGIIKRLMNEMQYLFQDYNDEQRQKIVNDVEVNMRKAIKQMKEYHPCKDKIKEDEKWKEYVKALARMEQVARTKEDISITETSGCYDACIKC